jgi:GT2 family glycosyltransferase
MGNSDLIGVVTVTYNSAQVLPDFLRCIAAQTHQEYILFVVDNASTDGTLGILSRCADERLRVIANPENRGVAAGNNQGIRAALAGGCESVLLINNDTEFDSQLVAQLAEGLAEYHVEMTSPKIMYYDDPGRIWSAGGKFQAWPSYRSVHLGLDEIDQGQHDQARLVSYVPTCCVLIEKEVFEKVGLMDEQYFVYWDDTDFMYRSMRAGAKLMYLPRAKLLHKVASLTGGSTTPFGIHYLTRNRLFFLLKHFGLTLSVPCLALSQLVWCQQLFFHRQPKSWFMLKQKAFRESLSLWWKWKSKKVNGRA